ncbi:hypothetical protein [Novosphingobium huizhouense]|uniref:hypothetical protein n=1 Tax=Novosphingobium huizhouense TaxID=2866625 RepID=UPI001CD8F0EF|nr:hypothetical protein [Novosphingobium huizhouense]
MIAGRLTMRASIERNAATGTDSWGNPVAPGFTAIGDPVACFVWSISATQSIDGGKTAELEEFRALFALGTDLQPGDQLAAIVDRRGLEIIPGRLSVEGPVQRKHTHLEAALRRIG